MSYAGSQYCHPEQCLTDCSQEFIHQQICPVFIRIRVFVSEKEARLLGETALYAHARFLQYLM